MKKSVVILIIMVILSASCSGYNVNDDKVTEDIFAMDTYMTLTAYGDNAKEAVDKSVDEIKKLDSMLSTGIAASDISQLNKNGSAGIHEETADIIGTAIKLNADTDGAFNPLIYPIMKCWGFDTGNYRIPSKAELEECRRHMDIDKIVIDDMAVSKAHGKAERNVDGLHRHISFTDTLMQIDLGGIAKGYTADRIKQIYKDLGVTSGIVNLGGNVQTIGSRADGTPWNVAVRKPDGSGEYMGILAVNDAAVVTSGGYERYFEQDGNTYHHIIDPATGCPAESGLKSVTIVNNDGMLADALSTAVYVMGYKKAVRLWKYHKQPFEMILIKDDDSVYITAGLADCYTSDEKYTIIER